MRGDSPAESSSRAVRFSRARVRRQPHGCWRLQHVFKLGHVGFRGMRVVPHDVGVFSPGIDPFGSQIITDTPRQQQHQPFGSFAAAGGHRIIPVQIRVRPITDPQQIVQKIGRDLGCMAARLQDDLQSRVRIVVQALGNGLRDIRQMLAQPIPLKPQRKGLSPQVGSRQRPRVPIRMIEVNPPDIAQR